jgi:hypothetical protein
MANLGTTWQAWILSRASMHHDICQNVYITSTASKRIFNTLDSPPRNSLMPQLSSTYILLLTAQDMTEALKYPHPDFPFFIIVDATITSLTTLADIFKIKFQKP